MSSTTQAAEPGAFACNEKAASAYFSSSDPVSLLYTVLPPLIQRRVPRIRSLRRTASTYGANKGHTRVSSEDSAASITPPPSYRTSNRNSTSLSELGDEESDGNDIFSSLPASMPASRPASRPSSSGSATPAYVEETESGVRWKYANQGYSLLSLSAQEATSVAQAPQFSRRLYLDGLTYLLRGLPTDLTPDEELSLRAALPESLSPPTPADNQLVLHSASGKNGRVQHAPAAPAEPSVLHRCTAQLVLYAFLALNFLLPYVQFLIRSAYQYDRKHHISDRLLQQGMITADNVGKQTLTLAKTVGAMNDGVVGERMREVGVWWVQGVTGGVYDGFGEGMEVLGLKAGHANSRVREEKEM